MKEVKNTEVKKEIWRPGTMLYPVPAVMISCADKAGRSNIITAAWTGTICSDPAMLYVSIRKNRFSHHMIKESGEFVVNLTTEELCKATDLCGVKSGKDVDKWKEAKLTPMKAEYVSAPLIAESPVNIECRVKNILELGTHDMFIAEVLSVDVSSKYINDKGRLELEKCGLIAYSHGSYCRLGEQIGTFGYSVRKKLSKGKKKNTNRSRKEKQTNKDLFVKK